MDVIKVNTLESIGDSKQGCLHVSDGGLGHIGRITFSIPPRTIAFNLNVNDVIPSVPSGKSAEEMLKKALEFANQGIEETKHKVYIPYFEGKNFAYELMATHLELLIKEAKNA